MFVICMLATVCRIQDDSSYAVCLLAPVGRQAVSISAEDKI